MTHTPSVKKIQNQAYVDSPYDLATKCDDAFRNGVDYVLENKTIAKCLDMHDELVNTLEQVKSYLERISCNIPLENQDSNEIAELILETLENAKGE